MFPRLLQRFSCKGRRELEDEFDGSRWSHTYDILLQDVAQYGTRWLQEKEVVKIGKAGGRAYICLLAARQGHVSACQRITSPPQRAIDLCNIGFQ